MNPEAEFVDSWLGIKSTPAYRVVIMARQPMVAWQAGNAFLTVRRSNPLLPQPQGQYLAHICHLSTLKSELILYRRCGLAYPYDWRAFAGSKKKTSVGLIVFNSSML